MATLSDAKHGQRVRVFVSSDDTLSLTRTHSGILATVLLADGRINLAWKAGETAPANACAGGTDGFVKVMEYRAGSVECDLLDLAPEPKPEVKPESKPEVKPESKFVQIRTAKPGDRVRVFTTISGTLIDHITEHSVVATVVAFHPDENSVDLAFKAGESVAHWDVQASSAYPGFDRVLLHRFDAALCEILPPEEAKLELTALDQAKVGDRVRCFRSYAGGSLAMSKTGFPTIATVIRNGGTVGLGWKAEEDAGIYAAASASYPDFAAVRIGLRGDLACEILPPEPKPEPKAEPESKPEIKMTESKSEVKHQTLKDAKRGDQVRVFLHSSRLSCDREATATTATVLKLAEDGTIELGFKHGVQFPSDSDLEDANQTEYPGFAKVLRRRWSGCLCEIVQAASAPSDKPSLLSLGLMALGAGGFAMLHKRAKVKAVRVESKDDGVLAGSEDIEAEDEHLAEKA